MEQANKFLAASAYIVVYDFEFPFTLVVFSGYNLGLGRTSAIRTTHCDYLSLI
jgi:hypothetical protein